MHTWRSARRQATERARESGGRPSGASGRAWSRGMDSFRVLKSNRDEEVVERTPPILPVSSLKAPTNSTTIFPPGCSTNGGLLGEASSAAAKDDRIPGARSRREAVERAGIRFRRRRGVLGLGTRRGWSRRRRRWWFAEAATAMAGEKQWWRTAVVLLHLE